MNSEPEDMGNSKEPNPTSPSLHPPSPGAIWQAVFRQQQLQLLSHLAALNPLLLHPSSSPLLHSDYQYTNSSSDSKVGIDSGSPKLTFRRSSPHSEEEKSPSAVPLKRPASSSSSSSSSLPRKISGAGDSGGREKVFTCKICERSFGYKHVLQNHERTHTGEKPFACKVCSKRFTRDHHLKTHMRLHTGEKPYSCTHCDRQFVQVANLRRHLRVHTGEKPYKCEICSHCFSDSNQLKAHLLNHSQSGLVSEATHPRGSNNNNNNSNGSTLHECNKCGSKFKKKQQLTHHSCSSLGVHPIEEEIYPEEEDLRSESFETSPSLIGTSEIHHQASDLAFLKSVRTRKSKDPKRINTVMMMMQEPQTEPEDLSSKKNEFSATNLIDRRIDLPQS
ncbi:uncharacterized protein [Lepeophtheirus salmonis]|uniref:C2H2-type domain-containing protein n=1 Tax=Lepeophtheirus salmonis TaxID=72036 RepID=A0A0K2TIM5_LEPSM|nr:protein krueppel-like [Lepeophtheirus salmonis]XP_040571356.1 protein krueppel-like [Lepeophtheirus salmonis]